MLDTRKAGLTTLLACLAALLLLAAPASAAKQRPFLEVFGSAAEPTFEFPSLLAVDPNTGDVLVGDARPKGSETIRRFKPNGEPDPFPALGTNVIDGKGSGACAYPPTPSPDCDKTEQNGIEVSTFGGKSQQIAVSPVSGDIFVTQNATNLVDIFSAEGRYLGNLTRAGTKKLASPTGVAVDSAGAIYVSQNGTEISKYVPSANPTVNGDNKANFNIAGYRVQHLAPGAGVSAGQLFVAGLEKSTSYPIVTLEVNSETGASQVYAEGFSALGSVDPTNGNPILSVVEAPFGSVGGEAAEFDGSTAAAGQPLSRLKEPRGISDLAASGSGEVYVVYGSVGGDPRVFVFGEPVLVPTVTAEPPDEITTNEATLHGVVDPEGLGLEECRFEALSAAEPQQNEVQKVMISSAGGGSFKLEFEGEATDPIPYGASGSTVSWALQSLSTIGERNIKSVLKISDSYYVTFGGGLGGTNLPQLTADASELTPSGASIGVETLTEGQGWSEATVLPCEPKAEDIPTGSGAQAVEARLTGLTANGVKYLYRLRASNENGTETSEEESFVTAHGVATEPATVTGRHSATLNGTIRPEGLQYDECFFKWGPVSNPSENEAPCVGSIPPDSAAHPVTAELIGLDEGTEYRFILFAKPHEESLQEGQELSFETFGPLSIDAVRASDATQSSVTLEADINPHGLDTSYRFEWGATTSYGNFAPASFQSIGHGTAVVRATQQITGLAEASTYHFRVVAESEAGSETSVDAVAETLDSCGLPDNRCFELVSRRDAGPIAIPGEYGSAGGGSVNYQVAPSGPGALAYPVESGYPEASKGATDVYLGLRDEAASVWNSSQLSNYPRTR